MHVDIYNIDLKWIVEKKFQINYTHRNRIMCCKYVFVYSVTDLTDFMCIS